MIIAISNLTTQNQMNNSQERRLHASTTIIYFVVMFLVCNFFTFLNTALSTYAYFSHKSYTHLYKDFFMFFYSWQLSDILCMALNAAIKPILYISCFQDMTIWLSGIFRRFTFI